MMRAAGVAFLALILLTQPKAAGAADKVDTVVMVNGDRTTCEVSTLSREQLKVKTDDQGTLTIKWDKIVSITTRPFRRGHERRYTPGGPMPRPTTRSPSSIRERRHSYIPEEVRLAPIRAGSSNRRAIDVGASTQSSVSQSSSTAARTTASRVSRCSLADRRR
jgi:hypothetical protein